MAYRRKPDISAYEEGAQEAERFIPELAEDYAERGFHSPQAAIQHYGQTAYDLLQTERVQRDPEHVEMLRGYLSRFD